MMTHVCGRGRAHVRTAFILPFLPFFPLKKINRREGLSCCSGDLNAAGNFPAALLAVTGGTA